MFFYSLGFEFLLMVKCIGVALCINDVKWNDLVQFRLDYFSI